VINPLCSYFSVFRVTPRLLFFLIQKVKQTLGGNAAHQRQMLQSVKPNGITIRMQRIITLCKCA